MSIIYLETLNIEKGQIDPKHNRRVKTKYRSRFDAEPSLRLKLITIDPDIVALCSQSHAHTSH